MDTYLSPMGDRVASSVMMMDEESCKVWLIELFLIETGQDDALRQTIMVNTNRFDVVGETFCGRIIPWDIDQFLGDIS